MVPEDEDAIPVYKYYSLQNRRLFFIQERNKFSTDMTGIEGIPLVDNFERMGSTMPTIIDVENGMWRARAYTNMPGDNDVSPLNYLRVQY